MWKPNGGYNYYDRLPGTTVQLPAKSVPIRYYANTEYPTDLSYDSIADGTAEWDWEDTQYGTVPGMKRLPLVYDVKYLHFYCEGDPRAGGQPVWLGECIPLGMDPDEWHQRCMDDVLSGFDAWRTAYIEKHGIEEEYRDQVDLNLYMADKGDGWD